MAKMMVGFLRLLDTVESAVATMRTRTRLLPERVSPDTMTIQPRTADAPLGFFY